MVLLEVLLYTLLSNCCLLSYYMTACTSLFMPTTDLDSDNRILKKIILEVLSIMAYHSEECHSRFLDALLLYKVGLCQRCMCLIRIYNKEGLP